MPLFFLLSMIYFYKTLPSCVSSSSDRFFSFQLIDVSIFARRPGLSGSMPIMKEAGSARAHSLCPISHLGFFPISFGGQRTKGPGGGGVGGATHTYTRYRKGSETTIAIITLRSRPGLPTRKPPSNSSFDLAHHIYSYMTPSKHLAGLMYNSRSFDPSAR